MNPAPWLSIVGRVLGVLALLALLWWAVVAPRMNLSAERAAHVDTKASHAAMLADLAAKARHVADLARRASDRVKTDREQVDARHREEMNHAKNEADRLRAALHSGAVELQDRWTCRVPGAGEGGAATDAGEADAEGRFDSIARVSQAADEDAAVIEWLWASWSADRQAVIQGGCAEVGP
ncbi:MAG TPA: lysis system i-spanin subunit Rz [Luteimonas sp.]